MNHIYLFLDEDGEDGEDGEAKSDKKVNNTTSKKGSKKDGEGEVSVLLARP